MISLTLTVTGGFGLVGVANGATAERTILREFETEVGKIVVEAVQGVLGHDSLYKLNPEYAARKSSFPGYRTLPGKDPDQPLILTAAMHDAVTATRSGNEVTIAVDPSKVPNAVYFDYPEYWESGEGSTSGFDGVHYLELGLIAVEHKFPQLLVDIIVRNLGL